MPDFDRIFLATENNGKLSEIASIFKDHHVPVTLGGLQDLPENVRQQYNPVESGNSFHKNAAIKAKHLFDLIHRPVIAEDSGLTVRALHGRPGIHSARYAASDTERIHRLLAEMKNQSDRRAVFVAVAALMINAQDTVFFAGRVKGTITLQPEGSNGFGYDPVFIPENENRTFAGMQLKEKEAFSHRGRAFSLLISYLKRQSKAIVD